jgi:hypothetical protein
MSKLLLSFFVCVLEILRVRTRPSCLGPYRVIIVCLSFMTRYLVHDVEAIAFFSLAVFLRSFLLGLVLLV